MADLEKVKKGLEAHGCGKSVWRICGNCPYRKEDDPFFDPRIDPNYDSKLIEKSQRCMEELLKDAHDILAAAYDRQEARVLTLEEIEQAPDYSLLYEEVRIDWSVCAVEKYREDKVETSIAPMEKRGGTLYGSGMNTDICPDMFVGEPGSECQVRYWLGRPTDQQREATPWHN